MSKYIINRKDLSVDDVIVESDGLTIGRLVGNELVLNHPTVSRTHAGIKEITGEFWISNLSTMNKTLLNGELVDKVPLVDNDLVQIGPFFLRVFYTEICGNCGALWEEEEHEDKVTVCPDCGTDRPEGARFCQNCGHDFAPEAVGQHCTNCGADVTGKGSFCISCGTRVQAPVAMMDHCRKCSAPRQGKGVFALSINVEMQVAAKAVSVDDAGGGTVLFGLPVVSSGTKHSMTRTGTKRVSGTGLLTSFLPPVDEQALQIFWEKRKREAGKLAEKMPLKPTPVQALGKAQFNWRPSLDLRRLWRKSYMAWGGIAAGTFSILALFLFPSAYSPGTVSNSHTMAQMSGKGIAKEALHNDCFGCHDLGRMQSNCTSCHTTATFSSAVSKEHEEADISCVGCHTEHQGAEFKPGTVSAELCMSCHNGTYKYKGEVLGIPHGGESALGYPIENNQWTWTGVTPAKWTTKRLPGTPDKFSKINQFHLIHFYLSYQDKGKVTTTLCIDCHETADRNSQRFMAAPRESCKTCHGASQGKTASGSVGPDCQSCHAQHGEYKELIASPRRTGIIQVASIQSITPSGVGGAERIRQNRAGQVISEYASEFGGVSGLGWIALIVLLPIIGFVIAGYDTFRRKSLLKTATPPAAPDHEQLKFGTRSIDLVKIQAEGPKYPYPVVDPLLCIGCHACVEACPHDVLAMVNGVSTPVAPEQCMEDTSCTIECPTQPKACVVLNTNKKIPPRKVPKRDVRFITDQPGVYIIGDVAGVPLIKMAINEGVKVMDFVLEDLKKEGPNANAEYDVAIIGVGPGGMSAAAVAHEKGLKYVAIEQEKLVATIQAYPAGKYVFFKPDTVTTQGPIPLPGVGDKKEEMIGAWLRVVQKNSLKIHEEESCKEIKKEDNIFRITTEKGKTKEAVTYRARKVVIAVGNRGAPMKLGCPGEDLTTLVRGYKPYQSNCTNCGAPRKQGQKFCANCAVPFEDSAPITGPCPHCGNDLSKPQALHMAAQKTSIAFYCRYCNQKIQEFPTDDYQDTKVKYKLSNPDDFVNKKCIVVGGGNSAIEAAVDLSGFKRDGNKISFIRNNEVALVVRSDFKGDLKLGNKMNIYDCMDAGKVKVYFGAAIKEISEKEVVLINPRSKEEIARLENDYIFALIGGEKPTKFLESIGIKIGG